MPSARGTQQPSQVSMGKKPMPYSTTTNTTSPNTGGGTTSPPVKSARAASKAPAIPSAQAGMQPSPPPTNAKGKSRGGGTASAAGGGDGGGGGKGKSNSKIWSTSSTEERERIRDFWLGLGEEERKHLVKIEKDTVLRKMKEQQKHSCSCAVCGRKRSAIEEELEVLYDAYYDELEAYANYQQRYVLSGGTLPPPPGPGPFPGSVEVDKHGTVVGANPSMAQYASNLQMQQQLMIQNQQLPHNIHVQGGNRKSKANARKKQKKRNRKMHVQQHPIPQPNLRGGIPPPPGIPNGNKNAVAQQRRVFHDGSDPGPSDDEAGMDGEDDDDEYEIESASADEMMGDDDDDGEVDGDEFEGEDDDEDDDEDDGDEDYDDTLHRQMEHNHPHQHPPTGGKRMPEQRMVHVNGKAKLVPAHHPAQKGVNSPTADEKAVVKAGTKYNNTANNTPTPLFTLPSLTISGPGNILTVADDLLKNDGQKFLEMMEQLAERRMVREEEGVNDLGGTSSEEEDLESDDEDGRDGEYTNGNIRRRTRRREEDEGSDEDDEDEDDEDDDSEGDDEDGDSEDGSEESEEEEPLTDLQKMEEGKRMFNIFAARMFEQRVLQAYREKVASERQLQLLRELEDEDKLERQRQERKEREREKKKDKKKQQKQQKESEKQQKAAEKAAEEAAAKSHQAALEAQQKAQKEAERVKRESQKEHAKKLAEEERLRKEEEKRKRLEKEREKEKEREAERERKKKEREEREAKEREDKEKKDRERREREERETKERREKEEKEKKEKEKERVAAEKAAATKKEKEEKERLAQQQKKASASQKAASGSKGAKAGGSVNATPSSSSSGSNAGVPGSKKILSKNHGVVGATTNAPVSPATAAPSGSTNRSQPLQPAIHVQTQPHQVHSRSASHVSSPQPSGSAINVGMLPLPITATVGSSQPGTPLTPHHPNMMMHHHPGHPMQHQHHIGVNQMNMNMMHIPLNPPGMSNIGMMPGQLYTSQGIMNILPSHPSATTGVAESPRMATSGLYTSTGAAATATYGPQSIASGSGIQSSVSVPGLSRPQFGVALGGNAAYGNNAAAGGSHAPAPPLTPGPSGQAGSAVNSPISPIGPPLKATGGAGGRRHSIPVPPSSGLESAFVNLNIAPGPISRPTPIARPHANSAASGMTPSPSVALGVGSSVAVADGSSTSSSPRRSPSPKPVGRGALGSSALVADDDEVVSVGGRRAMPSAPGTIGNQSPWGAPGSSSASRTASMASQASPWGAPANISPPSGSARLVPPPPLSASGVWGPSSGGRGPEWGATGFFGNTATVPHSQAGNN